MVIDKILASSDYHYPQNEALLNSLRLIQQELAKTATAPLLPLKSKARSQYYSAHSQIKSARGVVVSSHSVEKVKKVNKKTIEIFKTIESGRRVTEIEAFNGRNVIAFY